MKVWACVEQGAAIQGTQKANGGDGGGGWD